jgi:hypothetical protein
MNVGLAEGVDPGQVYSQLILSGDRIGPFVVGTGTSTDPYLASTSYGAGKMKLPPAGTSKWGKSWTSADLISTDIPIEVPSNGVVRLEAAIWWPADDTYPPNNLDIELVGPGGTVRSFSPTGVFERVRFQNASGVSGQWTLRVWPTRVGAAAQAFYWSVAMLPDLVP